MFSSFTVVFAEEEVTGNDSSGADYIVFLNDTMMFSESISFTESVKLWISNSTISKTMALLPAQSQTAFLTGLIINSQPCESIRERYFVEPEVTRTQVKERWNNCMEENTDVVLLLTKLFDDISHLNAQVEELNSKNDILIEQNEEQSEEIGDLGEQLGLSYIYTIVGIVVSTAVTAFYFRRTKGYSKIKKMT